MLGWDSRDANRPRMQALVRRAREREVAAGVRPGFVKAYREARPSKYGRGMYEVRPHVHCDIVMALYLPSMRLLKAHPPSARSPLIYDVDLRGKSWT